MKILSLTSGRDPAKPIKAFLDIELDGGIIIRGFRIIQDLGRRPHVLSPQFSYRDANGTLKFRTVVILPDQIKGEVDLLALHAWQERERQNGTTNNQPK